MLNNHTCKSQKERRNGRQNRFLSIKCTWIPAYNLVSPCKKTAAAERNDIFETFIIVAFYDNFARKPKKGVKLIIHI
jgi:hypothetical protein